MYVCMHVCMCYVCMYVFTPIGALIGALCGIDESLVKYARIENVCTVQITFILRHPAFRVLNVFYFQTDFNLRFKRKRDVRLTCHRVWCILHRTLHTQMAMPLTSHIIVSNS